MTMINFLISEKILSLLPTAKNKTQTQHSSINIIELKQWPKTRSLNQYLNHTLLAGVAGCWIRLISVAQSNFIRPYFVELPTTTKKNRTLF